MKRSQAVSLVMLVGAGTAALVLGKVDPSQDEEDVLVYPGADACVAAAVRAADACRSEYELARAAYPRSAPRYATREACEGHHGAYHCVLGESVAEDARGQYLPRMGGYVIGRTAARELAPQPVFEHAPQEAAAPTTAVAGGYGAYCTGSGGRIWTASGGRSSVARVASSTVRTASFGGFGTTGRSFASHASSGSAGG